MNFIPVKCTFCGHNSEVDETKEAFICPICGEAVSTKKANSLFFESYVKPYINENDETDKKITDSGRNSTDNEKYYCPNCGKPIDRGDLYCLHCGCKIDLEEIINRDVGENETQTMIDSDTSDLKENSEVNELVCPRCDKPVTKEDIYCIHCGYQLKNNDIEDTGKTEKENEQSELNYQKNDINKNFGEERTKSESNVLKTDSTIKEDDNGEDTFVMVSDEDISEEKEINEESENNKNNGDNISNIQENKQSINNQSSENNEENKRETKGKNPLNIRKLSIVLIPVAVLLLSVLLVYKNLSSQITQLKKDLSKADIGDYINIGNYDYTSDSKKDIEWLVLDKKDNRLFVISTDALDCQKYNSTEESTTWKKCTLREWLNNTFYKNAFSYVEKKFIESSTVEYGRNDDRYCTDKIFILNIEETNKYFNSPEDRKCRGTDYSIAQGAKEYGDDRCVCWWLRSPGDEYSKACIVFSNGTILESGDVVTIDYNGVRPAMWIQLEP